MARDPLSNGIARFGVFVFRISHIKRENTELLFFCEDVGHTLTPNRGGHTRTQNYNLHIKVIKNGLFIHYRPSSKSNEKGSWTMEEKNYLHSIENTFSQSHTLNPLVTISFIPNYLILLLSEEPQRPLFIIKQ